jgi:hypothetical protein
MNLHVGVEGTVTDKGQGVVFQLGVWGGLTSSHCIELACYGHIFWNTLSTGKIEMRFGTWNITSL